MSRRTIVVIVTVAFFAVATAAVPVGVWLLVHSQEGIAAVAADRTPEPAAVSPTKAADTGIKACQMMAEDKKNGTTPNKKRSDVEIELLLQSGNSDLHEAGKLLKTGDVEKGMNAVGLLFSGCAHVGVLL
jgi:hypothetical protein